MKELFDQLKDVKPAVNGRNSNHEDIVRSSVAHQMANALVDADGAGRILKSDLYRINDQGTQDPEEIDKALKWAQQGYCSNQLAWNACLTTIIGNPDICSKWALANGLEVHPPAITGAVTQLRTLAQHMWEKMCSEHASRQSTTSTSILPNLFSDLYAKR